MPRKLRLHIAGGIYHVVLRGNHRQPIFFRAEDYRVLEDIFQEGLRRYSCRAHAYCWMTNHIHVAVQVNDEPLGKLMRLVAGQYARFVQRRVPTTGHLFERRYRAPLVITDAYLMQLIRYIHLNPVRAGIAADAAAYAWSSHRVYLGGLTHPWLTTDLVLSLFGFEGDSRVRYARFMAEDCTADELQTIRASLSGHGEPVQPNETRINEQIQAIGTSPRETILDEIIRDVTARAGVTLAALASPSKSRVLAAARAEISRRALEGGVITIAELARRFNRAPSTICEAVQRHRRKHG